MEHQENGLHVQVENADEGNFGCTHYKRRCKIKTPCCDEIFDCRHCHNEAKNSLDIDPIHRHDVPRHEVEKVICSLCDTEQDVQQNCINCGVCMGNYYCQKCKFFDDAVSKNQYHCDQCGICRTGGEENFFHCDKCDLDKTIQRTSSKKVVYGPETALTRVVQQNCINCGVCMGNYYCQKCKFFDDAVSKNQYHCDQCGICRTGGEENFFHCDKCGCCYSRKIKDTHVCVERAMHHDCPICSEFLFDTLKDLTILPCGHTMHFACLKEMEQHHRYSCPVCSKSICDLSDVWEKLDHEIGVTPMPQTFKNKMRFLASSSSLWIKVIKSTHGNSGALDNPYSSRLRNSTWIGILKAINKLKVKGVDLMGFCKIVIGNGSTTRFWHDIWYGDICFKEKFKRLFNLELQKHANVASKLQASNVASSFRRPPRSGIENSQFIELEQILSSISLSSVSDRWSWTLHGLGDFSVKSAREEIDKHVLVVSPSQNRWSKVLPIKLNVFSWRMMLDRLPTMSNLYNRGINITCILCPNCGAAIENRNHLFFGCSMSVDLARLIGRWRNIHIPIFDDSSSWDSWFNGMNLFSMQRRILEATFVSMRWHIWKFRNLSIFSSKKPWKERIFDDIVSHTYFWLGNRSRSFNVSMNVWLNDPLNTL
ncbi:RNA-directed DNA polymerase, eukaryota, reverse transcriptase zinc-binding domain protein [Tanacetum coccineum]|uniref:RNA-directed DNA polymerase, eukaryota, reverse transcriptase zinc-binding domain protein n=1 Tax=Tanacetum coccineum TaxID=301880 RepID=A0ABQ4ZCS2_9ASTR